MTVMGWSIGFDDNWQRDIGYGVPCRCDFPGCRRKIHRGLAYVCGGEPRGGEHGCGLFFCGGHLNVHQVCDRCSRGLKPFTPKPDLRVWMRHKARHVSWRTWRIENPAEVAALRAAVLKPQIERAQHASRT